MKIQNQYFQLLVLKIIIYFRAPFVYWRRYSGIMTLFPRKFANELFQPNMQFFDNSISLMNDENPRWMRENKNVKIWERIVGNHNFFIDGNLN